MRPDRRVLAACLLVWALIVALEFAPALMLDFAGDDFELISLARVGGFHPSAIFVPHRGVFLKPVMNAAWALLAALLGARPAAWYLAALLVHLANGVLLATLAVQISARWRDRRPDLDGSPDTLDLLTGAGALVLWSIHDRLAEPIFSLASLNHSLTFSFCLLALLAFLRAMRTGAARDRLLAAAAGLLALFSYEVAASLLLVLPLMALLGVRFGAAPARKSLLAVLLLAGLPYLALQALLRLAPGTAPGAYYSGSAAGAARNVSEIGLAFVHLRTDWVAPGWTAALILAGGLAAIAALVRDPVVRFGIGWSAAACLPVLAIPVFSDRYHYIVFAGLALAGGRGLALLVVPRRRRGTSPGSPGAPERGTDATPPPTDRGSLDAPGGAEHEPERKDRAPAWAIAVAAGLVVVHAGWSFAGSRELAALYALRGWSARLLLREADAIASASAQANGAAIRPHPESGSIQVLFWWGEPDLNARLLRLYAGGRSKERLPFDPAPFRTWPFGEGAWPALPFAGPGPENLSVYVRPDGILGAVRPADLFNVAGAAHGLYYDVPEPRLAFRAIEDGSAVIDPVGRFLWASGWRPDLPAAVLEEARQATLRDRTIPVRVDLHDPSLPPVFHLAYLRRCTRAEAFASEYGPAGPGPAGTRTAGAAGLTSR